MTDSTAAPAAREAWGDALKGVLILFVVIWRIIMKSYLQVDWQLGLPVPGAASATSPTRPRRSTRTVPLPRPDR